MAWRAFHSAARKATARPGSMRNLRPKVPSERQPGNLPRDGVVLGAGQGRRTPVGLRTTPRGASHTWRLPSGNRCQQADFYVRKLKFGGPDAC